MKTCTSCKKEKNLDEFGFLKNSKDGHNYCCKSCHNSRYIKKTVVYPEGMKSCSICKDVMNTDLFSLNTNSKSGFKSYCKSCASIKNKEYRERCPDVAKAYRENNKEILAIKKSEYYEDNKDLIKEQIKVWQIENPEKVKISKKKHFDKNKEYYRMKNYEWEKNKRATDPEYRLIRNLRSLIGQSFSRALSGKLKRSKKSIDLLGCDFEFFSSYIESQLKEGMTFENYGEWELDHIKPMSSAKNLIEAEELNHYTNFQPLWKYENRTKSAKIEEVQLRLL